MALHSGAAYKTFSHCSQGQEQSREPLWWTQRCSTTTSSSNRKSAEKYCVPHSWLRQCQGSSIANSSAFLHQPEMVGLLLASPKSWDYFRGSLQLFWWLWLTPGAGCIVWEITGHRLTWQNKQISDSFCNVSFVCLTLVVWMAHHLLETVLTSNGIEWK